MGEEEKEERKIDNELPAGEERKGGKERRLLFIVMRWSANFWKEFWSSVFWGGMLAC